jgi:hypothetical protein
MESATAQKLVVQRTAIMLAFMKFSRIILFVCDCKQASFFQNALFCLMLPAFNFTLDLVGFCLKIVCHEFCDFFLCALIENGFSSG